MRSLEAQLIRHEGLRLEPYQDSEGYWTIGVGRLIDPRLGGGISRDEAIYLLKNDIREKTNELHAAFSVVNGLDSSRHDVLVNMAFNLGIPRLRGFRKMWAAIEHHDWDKAAEEMLDSKWARQVGRRAMELSDIMRTGVWQTG